MQQYDGDVAQAYAWLRQQARPCVVVPPVVWAHVLVIAVCHTAADDMHIFLCESDRDVQNCYCRTLEINVKLVRPVRFLFFTVLRTQWAQYHA